MSCAAQMLKNGKEAKAAATATTAQTTSKAAPVVRAEPAAAELAEAPASSAAEDSPAEGPRRWLVAAAPLLPSHGSRHLVLV